MRWKQAAAGKSLDDEMQTDEKAWAAMQMLDSKSREFTTPPEKEPVMIDAGAIGFAQKRKSATKEHEFFTKNIK